MEPRRRSAKQVIRAMVEARLAPPTFEDIVCASETAQLWSVLVEAFTRDQPSHSRKEMLTLEQRNDLHEAIGAALSPVLQQDLSRLEDAEEDIEQVKLAAAFALGLAFGQGLTGGAR